MDQHTQVYIDRLSDEPLMLNLARAVQQYYERKMDLHAATPLCLLQLENTYYKHDNIAKALANARVCFSSYLFLPLLETFILSLFVFAFIFPD